MATARPFPLPLVFSPRFAIIGRYGLQGRAPASETLKKESFHGFYPLYPRQDRHPHPAQPGDPLPPPRTPSATGTAPATQSRWTSTGEIAARSAPAPSSPPTANPPGGPVHRHPGGLCHPEQRASQKEVLTPSTLHGLLILQLMHAGMNVFMPEKHVAYGKLLAPPAA